jgi:hypothetical protein
MFGKLFWVVKKEEKKETDSVYWMDLSTVMMELLESCLRQRMDGMVTIR